MADYNLEGAVWTSHIVTWSFATGNISGQLGNFSSLFQPGAYETEIIGALARWSEVANVTFVQVSDSASANIRFGFGSFDGSLGILAQTSYYYDSYGHFLPGVIVRFDQAEAYNSTSQGLALSGGLRFEAVALHEIGHALGLGHYDGSAAIMNTYAHSYVTDLTSSDIHGIQALYGAASNSSPSLQPSGQGWQVAIIQDFNTDGHDDVLWTNPLTGAASVSYVSNGSLISQTSFTTPGAGWAVIAHGDYNNDGAIDLLWQNASTGQAVENLLTSGHVSSTLSFGVMSPEWKLISSGDFNGDGTDDMLWRNSTTGQGLEWFLENGHATSWRYIGSMGLDWKVASTIDLNHDGTADILWQNINSGEGVEWFFQGGFATSWARFGTMGAGWDIKATADFNSDGKTDLLWQEKSSGRLVEWFINDRGGAFDWRDLGSPGGAWKVAGLLDVNSPDGATILLQNAASGSTINIAAGAAHSAQTADLLSAFSETDAFNFADAFASDVDASSIELPHIENQQHGVVHDLV